MMTDTDRIDRLEDALVHLANTLEADLGSLSSSRKRSTEGGRRCAYGRAEGDLLGAIVSRIAAERKLRS
jgi:hypothetical protein